MGVTPGQVARARYWLDAALRLAGVGLIALWLVRFAGITTFYLFQGAIGALMRSNEFEYGLGALAGGVAVLAVRRPLVKWILPIPRGGCPECGYPIPALAAKCPECGTQVR